MANRKDFRGSIEKMREVAELLSGWADDMERSLEKKTGGKKATEEVAAEIVVPVEAAAESAVPVVPSFEELRGLLAAKSAAGYRAQVLALIRSYGVEKLSEVDPEHYAELMEAAAGLGEPLPAAGGGNSGRGEVSRNERSVRGTVATIEDAVGDPDAG